MAENLLLVVSPEKAVVGFGPRGEIVMRFDCAAPNIPSMPPGIELALELTPELARSLSQALESKADEWDRKHKPVRH